jgi:hypothetical protein
MRDLELLNEWLVLQRQHALYHAHSHALDPRGELLLIKVCAVQAEFCDRVREAIRVLTKDPGQFIKEYLPNAIEHQ